MPRVMMPLRRYIAFIRLMRHDDDSLMRRHATFTARDAVYATMLILTRDARRAMLILVVYDGCCCCYTVRLPPSAALQDV